MTNVIQGAETSVFPIDSTRFHVGQTYRIGIVSPKSVLGFLVDVALAILLREHLYGGVILFLSPLNVLKRGHNGDLSNLLLFIKGHIDIVPREPAIGYFK